jgi:hypothetical protein
MGFRVAAWRYRQADETDKLPHHYAEHWSTPGASAWGIQRLFTEDQLQQALNLRPQPSGETREQCAACSRGEVTHFSTDDGFWVEITTSAGGANEHGLNGWFETLEHYPDGSTKRREYVATDSPALSTTPARAEAQDEGAAGKREQAIKELIAGYAVMHEVICFMAGTSGAAGRWYYEKANAAFEKVKPLHVFGNDLATHPSPTPAADADRVLREAGWSVAVHNDYRLNGEAHTFWLWTHPDGRWIKGEGRTDEDALSQCAALIHPAPVASGGQHSSATDFPPDDVLACVSVEALTVQDRADYFGSWLVEECASCRGTGCNACGDDGVVRSWEPDQ